MTKIGIAFPDFISTEKIKRRKNIDGFSKSFGIRYKFLAALLLVSIAVLIFRIFTLQIIEGKYYRLLSDSNRIKTVVTHAPRGIITDRNGKPLVINVPGFRLVENGKTRLLNQEQALSLISAGKKDLEIDSLRYYPEKDATAHVLGYLGQITKEELSSEKYSGYRSGDLIGEMGIEEEYEGMLRGVDGKQLVEIDSSGKSIRKLGESDPIPGRNIRLTIDLGLQKKAYEAMRGVKKGAVIVTTPKGEVLALISKPTFDPNLFTQDETYKTATDSAYREVDQVLSDGESQPLLNRAIAGLYPPGSTFKIITAASGLNNKIIGRDYSIEDKGIIRVGEFSFANWYFTGYGRTDGVVNVVKGLARSNDIFFY
ncbi:MAG: hypothetical protein HYV38_03330, partial [Candidatus Levybacteria bacterium]|nr:hypothetical protein [Candidatus Levybacteria bacterium]